jgi:hypothetical protein
MLILRMNIRKINFRSFAPNCSSLCDTLWLLNRFVCNGWLSAAGYAQRYMKIRKQILSFLTVETYPYIIM